MPESEPATRTALRVLLLGVAGLVALPLVIFVLIVCEGVTFGTRHTVNGLEAIGLTPVLQAILDALGMNG